MASSCDFVLHVDASLCSLCENDADYHCKLCLVKLCSICISAHLSDNNKQHEIVNFTSKKKVTKSDMCSHEKATRQIYCRDCQIPICVKCVIGVHKEHHFIELKEFLEEKKNMHLECMKKIKCSILSKLEKRKEDESEKEFKNAIDRISDREKEICRSLQNYGSNLREKITKYKKDNDEKAYQNKFIEEKILQAVQEAKSLLASKDSKAILHYREIRPDLMESPQELNTCVPILDMNPLEKQDIAEIFGHLELKPVNRKDGV